MKSRLSLLLKNVFLPGGRVADLFIREGEITHYGAGMTADRTINCSDYHVLPAAVDLHVHMRGGPQSPKEDWGSGSRSALAGGVTVVVDQPNTIPPLTDPESFTHRVRDAMEHSFCGFAINSAVTRETPLPAMWKAGAAAFGETFFAPSSYGDAVDAATLSKALREIGSLNALATIHAEEVAPGNDENLATHTGLRSSTGEANAVRAVAACNTTGARLHFCHMSAREAVLSAKGTVEVTPHHLFLSHDRFDADDTKGKMNPPLRSGRERKALWTTWDRIDAIASDHAPHTIEEKEAPFPSAPSGVPGVETMVPLLMAQVLEKRITLADVIAKTSINPARILGIPAAGFTRGCRCDFALYKKKAVTIDAGNLHSRCGWTPFEGMPGVFPEIVIMGGEVVFDHGDFCRGSPSWIPGQGYDPQ